VAADGRTDLTVRTVSSPSRRADTVMPVVVVLVSCTDDDSSERRRSASVRSRDVPGGRTPWRGAARRRHRRRSRLSRPRHRQTTPRRRSPTRASKVTAGATPSHPQGPVPVSRTASPRWAGRSSSL
jgi:hypothetical protein